MITRKGPALIAAMLAFAGCGRYGLAQADLPARQWAAEAIRELDLQRDLPRRIDDPGSFAVKLPPELVWVPVIGGLGVLTFYLTTLLSGWRGGRHPSWEGIGANIGDAAPMPAAAAASAADALARAGRFAEAMHLTLLGSVAAIREQIGEEIADSLTSREILRSRRLSDGCRSLLREIVGRVERSHFGRYPASSADYAACRNAFDGLLQALRQERAA